MAPPMASALREKKHTNNKKKASVSFSTETQERVFTNHDHHRKKRARSSGSDDYEEEDDLSDSNYGDNDTKDYEEGIESKFSLAQEDDANNQGIAIEPFHMRNEREDGSGYFDGDTYVFRRNKQNVGEEEDAWMDDLEEQFESGKNVSSYARKEDDLNANNQTNLAQEDNQINDDKKKSICQSLVALLSIEKDETPTEALRRYGNIQKIAKKKNKKQMWKKQRSEKNKKAIVIETSDSEQAINANACILQIAELTDTLLISGIRNIYDMKRSLILKEVVGMDKLKNTQEAQTKNRVKKSYFDIDKEKMSNTTSESKSIKSTVQWEYLGNEDGKIHGPFTTEQMMSWRSAGFFIGKQAVDVRMIKEKSNFTSSAKTSKVGNISDMMADLDSDNDEDKDIESNKLEWLRSDTINFSSYLL